MGSSGAFDLSLEHGLTAAQDLMKTFGDDTFALGASLAYFGIVVTMLAGLVHRNHGAGMRAAGHALICFILLRNYDEMFFTLVRASDAAAAELRELGSYSEGLAILANQSAAFLNSQDDMVDKVVGLWKGSFLAEFNLLSHTFVFWCTIWIVGFTRVIGSFFYIIGPAMIAAGVFADGATLRAWGRSMLWLLLCPIFPAFVLMINTRQSGDLQLAAENLSLALSTNIFLSGMVLLTPVIVALLLSHGGVASLGAMAWGAGLSLGSKALRAGVGALGGGAGESAGEAGATSEAADASPARADDAPRPMLGPHGGGAAALLGPHGGGVAALPPPSKYVGPSGDEQWVRRPSVMANATREALGRKAAGQRGHRKQQRPVKPAAAFDRTGKAVSLPSAEIRAVEAP